MFCVKTHNKTYEMSASDQRQKVEWTQGVLVCMKVRNDRLTAAIYHVSGF